MRTAEALDVPLGRTLIAIWRWTRDDPTQRLTVASSWSADFAIRFPVVLDGLHGLSGKAAAVAVAATAHEQLAPENDHLVAQCQAWPLRHKMVVGGLVGRGLVTFSPAVTSRGLHATDAGANAAYVLSRSPGWTTINARAEALGKLRLSPGTLVERCRNLAAQR